MNKAVTQAYRAFVPASFPVAIINLRIPGGYVDVNLSPDKRTVLLQNEAHILAQISEQLSTLLEPMERTFTVKPLDHYPFQLLSTEEGEVATPQIDRQEHDIRAVVTRVEPKQATLDDMVPKTLKRALETPLPSSERSEEEVQFRSLTQAVPLHEQHTTMTFSMDAFAARYATYQQLQTQLPPQQGSAFDGAGVYASLQEASDVLSRTLDKQDFAHMDVIGQFNKGFILAALKKHNHHDLFIVDQHAADEKWWYEQFLERMSLQRSSQALVRPKLLELSTQERHLLKTNEQLFLQQGYALTYDGQEVWVSHQPEGADAQAGMVPVGH
jgi:DNA mismatch repair protein PMS2